MTLFLSASNSPYHREDRRLLLLSTRIICVILPPGRLCSFVAAVNLHISYLFYPPNMNLYNIHFCSLMELWGGAVSMAPNDICHVRNCNGTDIFCCRNPDSKHWDAWPV